MPNNPKAEKNLKPFKKGKDERRNLNGRTKLPDIKEALIKVLADEQEGMTALEAVIKKLRQMALKGDIRAIKELLDRGYGAPKQEIEQTGDVSITINKTYADNSD